MYYKLYNMININDDVAVMGASEMRNEIPNITKNLKSKKIIITKRGKPIAVLQEFQEYEEKEKLIDEFEDFILGKLAKERKESSKETDYISQEEMIKKLGIN